MVILSIFYLCLLSPITFKNVLFIQERDGIFVRNFFWFLVIDSLGNYLVMKLGGIPFILIHIFEISENF